MKKKTSRWIIVIVVIALLALVGGLSQWYLEGNLVVSAEESHSHAHIEEGSHDEEASEPDSSKNLVTNFSFEVGSGLEMYGWQASGEDLGTSVRWDDAVCAYGYRSASLLSRDSNRGLDLSLYQYLKDVPADMDVTVKGSIKTDELHGDAFLQVAGAVDHEQAPTFLIWMSLDGATGTTDWQTVQETVYFPPEVTIASVSVGIYGSGRAWFDGISVTASEHAQAPLPRDANLLQNPDFDQSTLSWHYFSTGGAPKADWSIADGGGDSGPALCLTQAQPTVDADYSGFFQVVNDLERTRDNAVLSGWLMTEGLEGEAWLSLVFYGKNGRTVVESSLKPSGNTGWQPVEVAVQVPQDSDSVWIQLISMGKGTACFDGLDFRLSAGR